MNTTRSVPACCRWMPSGSRVIALLAVVAIALLAAWLAPTALFGVAWADDPPTFAELRAKFDAQRGLAYAQRYQTVEALGKLKSLEAAEFLYQNALGETDISVRNRLLINCGRCAQDELMERLRMLAENAEQVNVQRTAAAIEALGYYGPEKAPLDFLEEKVFDTNTLIASSATRAIIAAKPSDLEERLRRLSTVAPYSAGYQIINELARLRARDLADIVRATLASDPWQNAPVTYYGYLIRALGQYDLRPEGLELASEYADDTRTNVAGAVAQLFSRANMGMWDLLDWCIDRGMKHDSLTVRRLTAGAIASVEEPDHAVARIKVALGEALEDADDRDETEFSYIAALLEGLSRIGGVDELLELILDFCRHKNALIAVSAISALGFVTDRPVPEDVTKELIKAVKSRRNPLSQGEGVVALARLGDVENTLEYAEKLLDNRDWHVRAAAIEALKILRVPACIPLLIERLDEEEGRLRSDVTKALQHLTGRDLPDDYDIWVRWWRANEEGYACPPPLDPGDDAQALAGRTGTFYGHEVLSKRVIFVIDISGSMSSASNYVPPDFGDTAPNKLDVAKHELLRALDSFDDDCWFNIIFFDTTFELWQPQLVRGTREVLTTARAFVSGMTPRGGTNIFDSLEAALGDDEADTIFLLTDGAPGSGRFVAPNDICREIAIINRTRRIAINTIGIQVSGSAEAFLKKLAEENHGSYHGFK